MSLKTFIGATLLSVTTLSAFSQTKDIIVSGRLMEGDTNQPAVQANIQLLSLPDSTYVTGNASTTNGYFTLPAVAAGKYLLKATYIGYLPQTVPLTLTSANKTRNVGTLTFKVDAVMLKETVVTAEAAQVQVIADSVVYNASAYRTPEGAMLEELVRKIPGAEIDDNGNVKLNGQDITKLLVNGKEFFGGDIATGLKNLPVEMVEKLKTYSRKSDNARITGIDDGEEEQVLDLTVKKGMNQGWFGNADAAYGTEDRYAGRVMLNRFMDNTQITAIGSANNTGDQGFSGGGGGVRFRSNMGLSAPKMGGISFATENDKLQLGGSFRYNHNNTDMQSIGSTQNFEPNYSVFSNSNSAQLNKNSAINFNFRLEWKIDSLTTLLFRPSLSWRDTNNRSNSNNAMFDDDPLNLVDNPNDYLDLSGLSSDPLAAIRVNTQNRKNLSDSKSLSTNGSFQLNRRLNSRGRNISLELEYNYSDSKSNQYSEDATYYSQNDSIGINNTFVPTPTNNYGFQAELSYSEPIARATYLQFRYEFEYSRSESDRKTYDLDKVDPNWNINLPLPGNYLSERVDSLSQYSKYDNYDHQGSISLLFNQEKYRLSVGVDLRPQFTELHYQKSLGRNATGNEIMMDTIVNRQVFNFAPNIDFRYRFSNTTQLRFNYRGRPSLPSMENLLDVTDYSNPLNITRGNPGLKPSFSHTARLNYNTYNAEKQRSIFANANFQATQNSITNSRMSIGKGRYLIQPKNINGNWNVSGMFGFNTALKNKKFNIGSFTNASYRNNVAYLYDSTIGQDLKYSTTNMALSERINASYRNDWFEFGLNGSISYNWEKNKQQPDNAQEPYTFSIGANTQIMLPWNMTFTTNITDQVRRGYTDASMNRNEWIWNAQLSQSFLQGAATVTFEMYDILRQQSNISRMLEALSRSVTQYNAINSYMMVHFTYRLNIFGANQARERMMQGRGGFGGGMPPGGMRPGGMGGGRPF
ncbi:MAG: outer membrane beta-barrel protein [Mediterranea sp.]|jgi:hypothetical protein|nr:outer membrane beta-barrel protein [Mediterranea sp.]